MKPEKLELMGQGLLRRRSSSGAWGFAPGILEDPGQASTAPPQLQALVALASEPRSETTTSEASECDSATASRKPSRRSGTKSAGSRRSVFKSTTLSELHEETDGESTGLPPSGENDDLDLGIEDDNNEDADDDSIDGDEGNSLQSAKIDKNVLRLRV